MISENEYRELREEYSKSIKVCDKCSRMRGYVHARESFCNTCQELLKRKDFILDQLNSKFEKRYNFYNLSRWFF